MPPGLTSTDILAVLPEIIILLAVCVALIAPVIPPLRPMFRASHRPLAVIALVGLGAALLAALAMLNGWFGLSVPERHILHGMLAIDRFALIVKIIIYAFTMLVIGLWLNTTRDDVRPMDGPDYVCLVLSAAFGMGLMASAANFLMIFLAIEASSFPSYALAGFNKTQRRSSESALKYVLIGAASSAFMLYGLSLLYGAYGTLDLAAVAAAFGEHGITVGLVAGLFGFMVGVGFKLSAVPIHFWCPDVFEAASIEITTFLSVASKAGAIALLMRVMMTLGYFSPAHLEGTLIGIGSFVGLIGVVTATWGNLAAYFQDNVKRLLAYSSIAHAGYMIMVAGLLTASMGHHQPTRLIYALLFYVFVYACMNLGAFTVAAIISRDAGSESLDAFAGLAYRNPWLAGLFGVFLLSLFGMPLTGGFWAKVWFGFEMWGQGMWWLVLALVVNTVFSLYFYLKPIIIMVWKQPVSPVPVRIAPGLHMILMLAFVGVMASGILPNQTTRWAQANATLTFVGAGGSGLGVREEASRHQGIEASSVTPPPPQGTPAAQSRGWGSRPLTPSSFLTPSDSDETRLTEAAP